MKNGVFIALILITGLIIASSVFAFGPSHGMGHLIKSDIDAVKKFQKETLPLRDELIIKKLELQKEHDKATPDRERTATLRKEIIDLETKIQVKADEAGLSEAGSMAGGCSSLMGRGLMDCSSAGCGNMMVGKGKMSAGCKCMAD